MAWHLGPCTKPVCSALRKAREEKSPGLGHVWNQSNLSWSEKLGRTWERVCWEEPDLRQGAGCMGNGPSGCPAGWTAPGSGMMTPRWESLPKCTCDPGSCLPPFLWCREPVPPKNPSLLGPEEASSAVSDFPRREGARDERFWLVLKPSQPSFLPYPPCGCEHNWQARQSIQDRAYVGT